MSVIFITFILVLGVKVLVLGPDLRPDRLHCWLAPKILGFNADPVMLYDVGRGKPRTNRCSVPWRNIRPLRAL